MPEKERKEPAETEPKPEEVKAELPREAKEAKEKPEAPDPHKELIDSIMKEMGLEKAIKRRLVKTLAEKHNYDKQKILYTLKRALITERYAAAHAGH